MTLPFVRLLAYAFVSGFLVETAILCGTLHQQRAESGDFQRRSLSPQPIGSGLARLAHRASPRKQTFFELGRRLYRSVFALKVKRPESANFQDRRFLTPFTRGAANAHVRTV